MQKIYESLCNLRIILSVIEERKMEKILVAVAWPYASASIHVGNMAGADLPPDVFARYQRLKGNDVLMVSGSDSHGTPVTVRADQEGSTPREVFERYHAEFLETFQKMGLTYDLGPGVLLTNRTRASRTENDYIVSAPERPDISDPDRFPRIGRPFKNEPIELRRVDKAFGAP